MSFTWLFSLIKSVEELSYLMLKQVVHIITTVMQELINI
jgi:hypothetical protein